jgi:1-acyl-sn-glycerol-3-phosphate acyltransferase
MLEANKSALFERIFAFYNSNLLKRRFHSFQVSGLDYLFNKSSQVPMLIYSNHSSWWDGLVAFQLSYQTRLNSYVMMEERQLKKLYVFRKLGAFSVVRDKPREAFKSIEYAARILKGNSKAALWIFPQGEILPNDRRPIIFYNGLGRIIEKSGKCETVSLAIRYEFLGEFKPAIFVKIEKPEVITVNENFNAKQITRACAQRLTKNLEHLKNDVINQNLADYRAII